MPQKLSVDVEALRMASSHIDVAADDLRKAHSESHDRIAAAQAGWIGSSGAALTAATTKWEQESTAWYAHLAEHASDFRSAGVRYTTTDQEAEAAITKNADALGL